MFIVNIPKCVKSRSCCAHSSRVGGTRGDEGRITVIRPVKPVLVDRIEKDIHKLTEFYEEGYACAKRIFEDITL